MIYFLHDIFLNVIKLEIYMRKILSNFWNMQERVAYYVPNILQEYIYIISYNENFNFFPDLPFKEDDTKYWTGIQYNFRVKLVFSV